jgi:hypothetical protein
LVVLLACRALWALGLGSIQLFSSPLSFFLSLLKRRKERAAQGRRRVSFHFNCFSISFSIYFSFFNKWKERKSWVELVSFFAEHYGRGRPITHHKSINQLFHQCRIRRQQANQSNPFILKEWNWN